MALGADKKTTPDDVIKNYMMKTRKLGPPKENYPYSLKKCSIWLGNMKYIKMRIVKKSWKIA